jgi:16S rRNA processing protein RimM
MTGDKDSSKHVLQTGSLPTSEPVFLVVGKLRRPHGIHGEMIMNVMTDFPERLKMGMIVFVGEEHQPMQIRSLRGHQQGLLVGFQSLLSPEAVGLLRNNLVYVKVSNLPALPEGEYYHHQVIGLRVVDESGTDLGRVSDVMSTGANDVFIVHQEDGNEFLLPVVDSMVLNIDIKKGEICARPLPGLIPDK